ncbi:MAG: N-acetylmuramoyl-L-alanine amidase [Oscillospiraceae bacterium]|jgi:N-acetylmuramoyl-L-alanine amidase|nr:N-acetylmuramoyl-L-alanine amidase [Oscillospiraceae bacterium]
MGKRVLVIAACVIAALCLLRFLPSARAADLPVNLPSARSADLPVNLLSARSAMAGSGRNYIIDAGHGGADGGAVEGDVIESQLNLQVALKLDALMGLFGKTAILTRDSNELDYPADADTLRKMKTADSNSRRALVRSTPNAVFISIHQNKFKSASAHGAQVFYGRGDGSRELAELLQESMRVVLEPSNSKKPKLISDKIFLMQDTGCPAVLVECGFISNPSERELLTNDAYQTKIAAALLSGLLQSIEQ